MRTDREVRVFAPATVANLGPGFDVLGMAIAGPGDTVTARLSADPGVRLDLVEGDGGVLPRDAADNTAGIAAAAVLRRAGVDAGVSLELRKGLPIGSGLGSSAASAAAAALAVNLLVGSPLRKAELVQPCLEAEERVSGRHADNVAPALLGGLILVRSVDPLDLIRLPVIEDLTVVVVTPDLELETRRAREALPREVPLESMVRHAANLAAMISALHAGDPVLLGRALQDEVITPARAALIPGCRQVIDAALDAGALGSSISGAGPSVFAFCRSARNAAEVAGAMTAGFRDAGLACEVIRSPASCPGARKL